MKCLVLSVDDAIGKIRRARLNYDFIWLKASTPEDTPDWVNKKMRRLCFHTDSFRRKQNACWYSWYRMFLYQSDNKIDNLILLEDDCYRISEFPNINDLGDEPIWLGGAIHHPTCFSKGNRDWEKNINLTDGINDLKKKGVRVQSNWGLYVPKWKQAKYIAERMISSNYYKTPDAHLCTLKVVNRLFFPPVFTPKDHGTSSIQSKGGKWNNRQYYKYR